MDCITNYIPQHEDNDARPAVRLSTPYQAGDKVILSPDLRGKLALYALAAALEHVEVLTIKECNPHYALVITRFAEYPVDASVDWLIPVPDGIEGMLMLGDMFVSDWMDDSLAKLLTDSTSPEIALDRRMVLPDYVRNPAFEKCIFSSVLRLARHNADNQYVLATQDGSLVGSDFETIALGDADVLYLICASDLSDAESAVWKQIMFELGIQVGSS